MKKKEKRESGALSEKGKPMVSPKDLVEEKPFDFGGLPQRDLKKNLGCG